MLKKFIYSDAGKKKEIQVKVCNSIWSKFCGLMFKENSPALLFVFNKEKVLRIHSFFCNPFQAIWLDSEKKVTKKSEIKKRRLSISGFGNYLLEIPIRTTKKGKTSSVK